jgi:hypothetical protein
MAYILLVEDDVQTANMMVRLLSATGFEVRHVLRGLKAAQLARLECPSLIPFAGSKTFAFRRTALAGYSLQERGNYARIWQRATHDL